MLYYIVNKHFRGHFEMTEIKKMLANQLNVKEEKLVDSARIIEDLGADSLDVIEMLMTLEEEYNIKIPDEKALELKTVGDVVAYIEKVTKSK